MTLAAAMERIRILEDQMTTALIHLDDCQSRLGSKNKSSATKRNMSDEDALACLQGEAADLDHKLAAEKLGLTYAQVYSCRLEYTFKHVHKILRGDKWHNPWVAANKK